MKCYFITATGTDIGKTFFTTELIKYLKAKSYQVKALKPVISGFDIADKDNHAQADNGQLLTALGEDISVTNLQKISPINFTYPAAPDVAARYENKPYLDYQQVLKLCTNFIANQDTDFAFIEGVGGVMVPLNQDKLISNLITDLNIEVILISANYLGTLSHTLTALNSLQECKLKQVIINDIIDNEISLNENITSLENFTKQLGYKGKIHKLYNYHHSQYQNSLEKLAQMLCLD